MHPTQPGPHDSILKGLHVYDADGACSLSKLVSCVTCQLESSLSVLASDVTYTVRTAMPQTCVQCSQALHNVLGSTLVCYEDRCKHQIPE